MVNGIIIGFFIGSIVCCLYINWFIKTLKKKGYIIFDITDKFRDEILNNKMK